VVTRWSLFQCFFIMTLFFVCYGSFLSCPQFSPPSSPFYFLLLSATFPFHYFQSPLLDGFFFPRLFYRHVGLPFPPCSHSRISRLFPGHHGSFRGDETGSALLVSPPPFFCLFMRGHPGPFACWSFPLPDDSPFLRRFPLWEVCILMLSFPVLSRSLAGSGPDLPSQFFLSSDFSGSFFLIPFEFSAQFFSPPFFITHELVTGFSSGRPNFRFSLLILPLPSTTSV